MEKRAEKAQKRVRSTRHQLAAPTREKMAGQVIGKRTGSGAYTEIFKRDRGLRQTRSKREGAGVAEEERSGRRGST